jgi:glutathione peroxidase
MIFSSFTGLKGLILMVGMATSSLLFTACGSSNAGTTPAATAEAATASEAAPAPTASSVYEFKLKNIDGQEVSLDTYKGQVMVFINVASNCGYTRQYEQLEAFYKKYQSKGVVLLGFPANNFGGQEPGTETEIKAFCQKNYGVTFPMFSKISVKGNDIHPLYQYLTSSLKENISWNFNKIIVDKAGKPVRHFKSGTNADDADFIKAVEQLL